MKQSNELICDLRDYLKGLIDYNASFIANHSSGRKQFTSQGLLLMEMQDINKRLKRLNERKLNRDKINVTEMTFKSNVHN